MNLIAKLNNKIKLPNYFERKIKDDFYVADIQMKEVLLKLDESWFETRKYNSKH